VPSEGVRRADGRLSRAVLPDKDTAISILKFGDDLPNLAGTASYFATSLAAWYRFRAQQLV